MRKAIILFYSDRRGSAMLEYSLVMGAIAICVVSGVSGLGGALDEMYRTILTGVTAIGGLVP
jgi:Flp pilus assembly pilin Flp